MKAYMGRGNKIPPNLKISLLHAVKSHPEFRSWSEHTVARRRALPHSGNQTLDIQFAGKSCSTGITLVLAADGCDMNPSGETSRKLGGAEDFANLQTHTRSRIWYVSVFKLEVSSTATIYSQILKRTSRKHYIPLLPIGFAVRFVCYLSSEFLALIS